jgi:hypothetical protein
MLKRGVCGIELRRDMYVSQNVREREREMSEGLMPERGVC